MHLVHQARPGNDPFEYCSSPDKGNSMLSTMSVTMAVDSTLLSVSSGGDLDPSSQRRMIGGFIRKGKRVDR